MKTDYLFAALLLAFVLWKVYGRWQVRRRVPGLIQSGAQVVDVRSAPEFAAAHYKGSTNIPLPELERRAGELPRDRWIVLCCASGTRSATARRLLRKQGYSLLFNAGSWRNLAG